MTKNEHLIKAAEKAVQELFEDQSVSKSTARQNLNDVITQAETLLETLGDEDED